MNIFILPTQRICANAHLRCKTGNISSFLASRLIGKVFQDVLVFALWLRHSLFLCTLSESACIPVRRLFSPLETNPVCSIHQSGGWGCNNAPIDLKIGSKQRTLCVCTQSARGSDQRMFITLGPSPRQTHRQQVDVPHVSPPLCVRVFV